MATPRNVLIIMTDQQRADFRKSQGFALDTMPFLDSLEEQGVGFDAAYTPMPICSPARISMLTGRYPSAHGQIANWSPLTARCTSDLAATMRSAGYETALFGKNHSHMTPDALDVWREYSHTSAPLRPGHEENDAAFDAWMEEIGHWVCSEPTPFPLESQYPVRITNDFVGWLAQRSESQQEARPFCAWVSFPEPHSPYQAPEPYFSLFPEETIPPPGAGPEALAAKGPMWQQQYAAIQHYHPESDSVWPRLRATYCGMLRLIDDQLRRIIGALEAHDLLRNTVVVYVSDHGEFAGDYGLYRKGLGLPQCAIRVPMLWLGGGIAPRPQSHPAHVSLVDIFPTLCEATGAPIPQGVQGRSLWPLLQGEPWPAAEFASAYAEMGIGGLLLTDEDEIGVGADADTLYVNGVARTNFDGTRTATAGYRRALVMGNWKLIYDLAYSLELYNLGEDPLELNNLAEDARYSAQRAALLAELLHWSVRLADNSQVRRYNVKRGAHNWDREA
jgi:arylsulfatase A-like enzyme